MNDPSQLVVLIPGLAFWAGLLIWAWRDGKPLRRSRRASHDSAGLDDFGA